MAGKRICYWGLAMLIAALYAVISALTPYALDDWRFLGTWRDDVGGGWNFSFSAWKDYYAYISSYDNGRLANVMSPISTMFSPWKELFPVATGCLLAFVAVMLQRFASRRPGGGAPLSAPSLAMAWLLMIVFLPWRDTLFVRDYSLNYIWSAAITITLLWLMAGLRRPDPYGARLACALLLAAVAGWWHEGFAAATLCGLALLALTRRLGMPWRFYLVCAVYLVSTLVFMNTAGMSSRIANNVGVWHGLPHYRELAAPAVLVATALAAFVSGKGSKAVIRAFSGAPAIVAAGIIIGGYAIAVMSVNTARSYFWPILAVIFLELRLLQQLGRSAFRVPPKAVGVGAFLVAALCMAQSLAVIVWQNRYREETEEIMALLDSSSSGVAYYDLRLPPRAPRYTLSMPSAGLWRSRWNYPEVWNYYNTPMLSVVPTVMHIAPPVDTITVWNGHTIGPFVNFHPESNAILPEVDGEGRLALPFITERGDTLLYYSE